MGIFSRTQPILLDGSGHNFLMVDLMVRSQLVGKNTPALDRGPRLCDCTAFAVTKRVAKSHLARANR